MFRNLCTLVAVSLALTACAGESTSTVRDPNALGKKPIDGSAACFIYPAYSVADCSALTKRTTLVGQSKTDYTYKASNDRRYKAPTYLIDLNKIALSSKITKNFVLNEYMSTAKGRYGYVAEHTFTFVQRIREALAVPLRITSGYRSPAYNKRIGGATLSRHVYGDGVDLAASAVKIAKLRDACRAQGASYIQVYTDGHVHCDWRSHKLDDTFVPNVTGATMTPAMVSALSDDEYALMQEEIGGKPQIAIEGEIGLGETVEISAALEAEDPGELMTEWIVTAPNGVSHGGEGLVMDLDLQQKGSYVVQVRVGGYAQQQQIIEVK